MSLEITKLIQDITPYFKYENESGATTQDQFQAFLKNLYGAVNQITASVWQPQTAYAVGRIITSPNLPYGMYAIVTTGGTTGTTEPSWTTSTLVYADGTVKWKLKYKGTVLKVNGNSPNDYGEVTVPIATEAEAKAQTNDTHIMTPLKTKYAIENPSSIYQRNGYYRGKNLGTLASTTDVDTFVTNHGLSTGAFTDIFVGDYVTIKDGTYNAVWLVAGIDWDYNKGDTASGHGVLLIPKTPLYNATMNDTNTTEGGYAGSRMHTTELPALVTILQTVLGTHLKKRRVLLSNAISTSISCGGLGSWTGASSGWAWTDTYAVLPSENEVYGSPIWSSSGYDAGEANQQLPIFKFINPVQFSRWDYWLRSFANSTDFCRVSYYGGAAFNNASYSRGVRPLIYLG